ncbi:hypothetical protein MAL08_09820 [Leptospira noguchii]|uniref:Uncharacterized protein n=3 Tax=Leptospira noguchii TaxID=28182 RepID=A0A9Q8VYG6_9LEPT|nr:hypothetical protein [Leptospira noguchii]EKR72930.1 putative lipoprotein [Leptospira noguchii str. 2006001870]EMI72366.1 putative lipoprotein [Leptospira noguchii str. Bonito]EMM98681.1 putative lipoprotein [Leptospira noguchii str. 2007001578]EMO87353.1 putative lipoprotein [Leptospira noguchii str. 2001034031]TQE75030.1 hypothetical protein FF021_10510 [Leptospira noguchii]
MKQVITMIALITIVGCVSLPENLKKKSSPNSSILAISLNLKPPIGIFGKDATEIVFIKQADSKQKNSVSKLIQSNFSANGYVYLLNAEPGIYSVVLAGVRPEGRGDNSSVFYLTNESIQKIKIKIDNNTLVYAGKYDIQSNVTWSEKDWIDVPKETRNIRLQTYDGDSYFGALTYRSILENVDTSDIEKQKFLEKARNIFAESEWTTLIK